MMDVQVLAWPVALYQIFKKVDRNPIGQGKGENGCQYEENALPLCFINHQENDKHIKRDPHVFITQKPHDAVQKRRVQVIVKQQQAAVEHFQVFNHVCRLFQILSFNSSSPVWATDEIKT